MLRLWAMFLIFTGAVSGQQSSTKAPPGGRISCSSKVDASTCKWAVGAFTNAQRASVAMRSVEVFITDNEAFSLELDRLKTARDDLLKAHPSSIERSKPTLPSAFKRSILFELGGFGVISKVVVRVELFNQVNSAGARSETGAPPVEFDKDSAMTWATYIMGYVEGCNWSRAHTLAESTEPTN